MAEPYHIGRKLTRLVPRLLDKALADVNVCTKKEAGWTTDARARGLFFDLSRVEWIEALAVAQVVLLVESALRSEIAVDLAMPLPNISRRESVRIARKPEKEEQVDLSIGLRAGALRYLDYLGFEGALMHYHLAELPGQLRILHEYDPLPEEDEEEIPAGEHDAEDVGKLVQAGEWYYQHSVPLNWIPASDMGIANQLTRELIDGFLNKILSHELMPVDGRGRSHDQTPAFSEQQDVFRAGLGRQDADVLTNVVLYELVDNVGEHAERTQWALLTAWLRPSSAAPRQDDFYQCAGPFIGWARSQKTALVEVVLGDSGAGIVSRLKRSYENARVRGPVPASSEPLSGSADEDVLLWAFDRWSTRKDGEEGPTRGTRGLYRVDRVVQKYQGLTLLRSSNQLVGQMHGGRVTRREVRAGRRVPYYPGTLLQSWLVPQRPGDLGGPLAEGSANSVDARLCSLGHLTSDGFSSESIAALKNALMSSSTDHPVCVIGVVEGGVSKPKELEAGFAAGHGAIKEALRQSAELRHPALLVVYGLPGDWSSVAEACNLINEELEQAHRDSESESVGHFTVWDPVLVINSEQDFAWTGASKTYAGVLKKLLQDPRGQMSNELFAQLVPDEDERAHIVRQMRGDPSLISWLPGGFELRIGMNRIVEGVRKALVDYIDSPIPVPGVLDALLLGRSAIITPALHKVSKWVDIGTVLRKTCGPGLAMMALGHLLKKDQGWSEGTNQPRPEFVVTDSTVHMESLQVLMAELGVKHHVRLPINASSVAEFGETIERGTPVVVHVDVVVSQESVHHCLRKALRDGALPIAATCVLDARAEKKAFVDVWGFEIPLISLVEAYVDVSDVDELRGDELFIDPLTRLPDPEVPTEDGPTPYVLKTSELTDVIEKHCAMYFNHFVGEFGRHFTFYFDADQLFEGNTDGLQKLLGRVLNWADSLEGDRPADAQPTIDIIYPQDLGTEGNVPNPARRFAEWIAKGLEDRARTPRPVYRYPSADVRIKSLREGYQRPGPHILFADWSAVTGETIEQVLERAASEGASSVLVCLLSSQMPQYRVGFMSRIEQLAAMDNSGSPEARGRNSMLGYQLDLPGLQLVPAPLASHMNTSLVIGAHIPIESYTDASCPLCRQRRRLIYEEYPSVLLTNFSQRYRTRFSPTPTQALLGQRNHLVGLDGQELTPEAITWIFALREELSEALTSTRARLKVKRKLDDIFERALRSQEPPADAQWLLHFLTVESNWLRKPPIYSYRVRANLADLAFQVAAIQDSSPAMRALRSNAIVVLRTSSKEVFAQYLPQLMEACRNVTELLEQLLYDVFTYLDRPYVQTVGELTRIHEPLEQLVEAFKKRTLRLPVQFRHTVQTLEGRASFMLIKARAKRADARAAWREIRKAYSQEESEKRHPPVRTALDALLLGPDVRLFEKFSAGQELSEEEVEVVKRRAQGLSRVWEEGCQLFLRVGVIPHLEKLKPVLWFAASKGYWLRPDDVEKLVGLCNSRDPSQWYFSVLVRKISEDVINLQKGDNWANYQRELRWFSTCLLATEPRSELAQLARFIEDAPARCREAMRHACDEIPSDQLIGLRVHGLDSGDDPDVFCTGTVLDRVFGLMVGNVAKHHDASKDSPPEIWFQIHRDGESVVVTVSNNHRKTLAEDQDGSAGEGEGLSLVAEELAPFEATVEPHESEDGFAVVLRFLAY